MSLWGIGPKMIGGGVLTFVICLLISTLSEVFKYPVSYKNCVIISLIFFLPGIALWLTSAYSVVKGFSEGRLVTTGAYAVVRNPLYASFIIFIAPAFSFLLNSWLLLLSSVAMYLIFKACIVKEERFLKEKFGSAFTDYRRKVSRIIPFID